MTTVQFRCRWRLERLPSGLYRTAAAPMRCMVTMTSTDCPNCEERATPKGKKRGKTYENFGPDSGWVDCEMCKGIGKLPESSFTIQPVTIPPTPTRPTGCCEVLGIEGKPDHQRCPHQCDAGCDIYATRPNQCQAFSCLYLQGQIEGDERRRPDKLGLIFYTVPTNIGNILGCWEAWPGAALDDPGRSFLQRFTSKGPVLVCSERGRFLVSPKGIEDWDLELDGKKTV
jgi:hypothetical protein